MFFLKRCILISVIFLIGYSCSKKKDNIKKVIGVDVLENTSIKEEVIYYGQYTAYPRIHLVKISNDSTILNKLILYHNLISNHDSILIKKISNKYDLKLESVLWSKKTFWNLYSTLGEGSIKIQKRLNWWDYEEEEGKTIYAAPYHGCNYPEHRRSPRYLGRIVVVQENDAIYLMCECP